MEMHVHCHGIKLVSIEKMYNRMPLQKELKNNPRGKVWAGGEGLTSRTICWGCMVRFPKPSPYLICNFPHPICDQIKHCTLFVTVEADIVARDIIFEGLLFMTFSIMIKK